MTREIEYHDAMTNMLELIWGVGFMTPGGEGNVANLVDGLELEGKRILDIGCGIGGPAFVLASKYGAHVTGIDIEPQLIEQARIRAEKLGLSSRCKFIKVAPGPLEFPDDSFDVVFSAGVIMTIEDQEEVLTEAFRVLKPGGTLTVYDWMKREGEYSEDMLYWFKMERLTYAMKTFSEYKTMLQDNGFIDIELNDRSKWYRQRVQEEYEQIKSDLYPKMLEVLGKQEADHFVENWRSMVVVCLNKDVSQGYYRGRKPVDGD
ncbi:MAG: SAM-dependent methyltransferase [Woeseia sp.]|nr:SAM-dependent methyltransferase [Woeseia sp.]|tara:strand:- start:2432 stop:3214 length:783 start_codon:yes stop_codon:yes gene_type:complete